MEKTLERVQAEVDALDGTAKSIIKKTLGKEIKNMAQRKQSLKMSISEHDMNSSKSDAASAEDHRKLRRKLSKMTEMSSVGKLKSQMDSSKNMPSPNVGGSMRDD